MRTSLSSMDSFLWKYRDYLRRLARRRLGSRLRGKVDESDLVQEAILQAHLAKDQFRGKSESERRAWFRTILKSKVAGALRRFSRRRRDLSRETSLEPRSREVPGRGLDREAATAATSTPSWKAVRDEELTRLAEALSGLPDDQRRAVEMHHLEGLPIAEIAARMGRSKTSVAGLVFRGVRGLRARLADFDTGKPQ
jgi:RNA polymerase sigma-70 factor, ECF subfamily